MENVSVVEFYAIGRSLFKFDEVADFAERGNNAWKLFEKLGKWGAPEAIQWAFVRNTVGFGQAVSYMSEAYTKNAFSKFTEVLLSVNSDSPVIVIGGNDYDNVVVQKDHINTNVLPNHEIVVHQFTESELSEMESFITEWENNYSDSNFNQEDFMIRFKTTGAISRYCAFLNANKDNTFVDVSRFHGVEFSSITSIPDPLYYIEREIVFKEKTKYENWGR